MFISIIIPVYNVEHYLRDCLESVAKQSFQDFEIICVNDGSTDGSLNILQEYSAKNEKIIIVNQANKGLSGARNVGVEVAKGDYLFFLDSDDWIELNTLEIFYQNLADAKLDLLCINGKLKYESTGLEEQDKGFQENLISGWDYYNKYSRINTKFHFDCSVLRIYRREFIYKHNLRFQEGIFHEDSLWTPTVLYYAQSVRVIPNPLYVYRIREGSIMRSLNLNKMFDVISIANMLAGFFIPIKNINKSIIYGEISRKYFAVFVHYYNELDKQQLKKVKELINWEFFKTVSKHKRHRIIYNLIRINPLIFRIYYLIEQQIKNIR